MHQRALAVLSKRQLKVQQGKHGARLLGLVRRQRRRVHAGLDQVPEHVHVHANARTAVLSRVAGARKLAVRVGYVLTRRLGALAAVQLQLVAAPALLAVLDTRPAVPAVPAALLQAVLNRHVLVVVGDLRGQQTALRGL